MIIAGNWKMNKNANEAVEFVNSIKNALDTSHNEIVLCVPFVNLLSVLETVDGTGIKVGAQNMFYADSGAYTGEVSADMLKSIGVEYVIVGHSERRTLFQETDELINKKLLQSLKYNLKPILCVGETLDERESNMTLEIINSQLKNGLANVDNISNVVIAYEPVWAIGTGKTATSIQAQEVCHAIRNIINEMYGSVSNSIQIQYGGSVNSKNATELFNMQDIDGGLIGGASLTDEFVQIANTIKVGERHE